MTNRFNTKRTFSSLFTSLVVHLVIFIILGFIFLKGKPYEEYIQIDFTLPVPEPNRKLQVKKPIARIINPSAPNFHKVIRENVPEVSTDAKIDGYSDVYLSPSPSEESLNPTMSVPKTHRIMIPQKQFQSKTEISFVKPKFSHSPKVVEVTNFSVIPTELKLPSTLNIPKKIDIGLDAIKKYREAIKKRIEEEKRYPDLAEENGYQGKVELRFKLLANGGVEEVEVLKSSGYAILDKEAVRAVKNAIPYPAMPESIKREYIVVEVPILFKLR